MPGPIGSVSYGELSWVEQPAERDDFRETLRARADENAYGVCRCPNTVIGGLLCGDETAVSNACRRAKIGTLDEFLCDDLALHKIQREVLDVGLKAWQMILGAKMSR